ncbi:UNVERIFIED_CONTAM: hypothetical protein Slati_1769800 [Sesamum latifolium]|uniref:Uncharacterized protein n=1 Tax=Sesamum latifolium TaxID=2727402 RepID=A0AAW2WX20_9LAMI
MGEETNILETQQIPSRNVGYAGDLEGICLEILGGSWRHEPYATTCPRYCPHKRLPIPIANGFLLGGRGDSQLSRLVITKYLGLVGRGHSLFIRSPYVRSSPRGELFPLGLCVLLSPLILGFSASLDL